MIQHIKMVWADATLRMLGFTSILFGAVVASIVPYQSLIGIKIMGISNTHYAVLLAVSLLVSVAASTFVGIVTDQRPSRKLMALLATSFLIVSAMLMWIGNNATAFVLAHAVLIPISATLFSQIFALTRLCTQKLPAIDRDGILVVIRTLFAVPFAVVLPLWGLAIDGGLPLVSVYQGVLVLGVVLLIIIVRYWPSDSAATWVESKSKLGFFASLGEITTPQILTRVILMGAVHAGSTLLGILLALVFDATPERGAGDVGVFFGTFVALEVILTSLVTVLLRHLTRLHIIAIGGLSYAIFLVFLPALAPSVWVWILIFPAAAGGAFLHALTISYLQDLLEDRAGAGASLMALQKMVADGLAATIFAVGAAISGYHVVAYIGGTVVVFGICALLWIDRNKPH